MKITFEGTTLAEILGQMQEFFMGSQVQGPGPEKLTLDELDPMDKPVNKPSTIDALPVDKPKAGRTEKQKANDEKLRERALAKKAAGLKVGDKAPKAAPVDKPETADPFTSETAEQLDPAKVVAIRQKTIEDLQTAYANGHQAEVFELLSKFGNGAKSFRELPPEAFMPIREAIDNGALT